MRNVMIVAVILSAAMLQACAVNVVTVNVTGSELGYVDQGHSEQIVESNLGGESIVQAEAY